MMLTALFAVPLVVVAREESAPPSPPPSELRVFRSVLDERARMLTACLDEDLWVAYDAATCALYAAWPGGVKLQGAVYDTVHGPQPRTEGPFWLAPEAPPGGGKHVAWRVFQGDERRPLALETRYLGYRLDADEAPGLELHWELRIAGEAPIDVRERPGATEAGLRRTFLVRGLPDGVVLELFSGLCSNPRGEMWAGTACRVGSTAWGEGRSVPEPARVRAWLTKGVNAGSRWVPWYVTLGEGRSDLEFELRGLAEEADEDADPIGRTEGTEAK